MATTDIAPPASMSPLKAFILLGRFKFLFQSLLVVCMGVTAAQHDGADLDLGWAAGILLFAWVVHLMTHYCNEYFDLEADRANEAPTSWTGGSRILVRGLLPPIVSLGASFVLLFVAMFIAAAMPDTPSRLMAVTILVGAWFYTAPPLKFNYRALGEFICALTLYGLGPLLVFRLQAGPFSRTVAVCVAVIFCFQFLRMAVMNLADVDGDRRVGKITLAVRFGPRAVVRLFVFAQVLLYAVLVLIVALSAVPLLPGLALLATFPVPLWVGTRLWRGALADPRRANAVTFWSSMHMPATSVAVMVGLLADMFAGGDAPDTRWSVVCGASLAFFAVWFTRTVRRAAAEARRADRFRAGGPLQRKSAAWSRAQEAKVRPGLPRASRRPGGTSSPGKPLPPSEPSEEAPPGEVPSGEAPFVPEFASGSAPGSVAASTGAPS